MKIEAELSMELKDKMTHSNFMGLENNLNKNMNKILIKD
jgi:hypothetical protein